MSEEQPIDGYVDMSKNPHYRPPLMKWNYVEIICPEGSHVRIAADGLGLLSLEIMRQDGIDHLCQVEREKIVSLPPGDRVFVIRDDERGPPIDHAYDPDAEGLCLVCRSNGSGWKPGDNTCQNEKG